MIYSNMLPGLEKYYETNVETYNVALKTKEYILSNTDMPGIESNESFAITIKMSGGNVTKVMNGRRQ